MDMQLHPLLILSPDVVKLSVWHPDRLTPIEKIKDGGKAIQLSVPTVF